MWPLPEKGEISTFQEDSSLFRLHPLTGYGRRKEKFPRFKKILLSSGCIRLQAMAGERRNFWNPRRFFSFTGGRACGYGRRKEKFPRSKKILLLHRRLGVWPGQGKREISKSQEDSSLFRLHPLAAKAGKRRNFQVSRRFFSFAGSHACSRSREMVLSSH